MAGPEEGAPTGALRPRPALATALAVLAVLVVAFTVRLENVRGVFGDGEVWPNGVDSHYHGRRIVQAVRDWPNVVTYDLWVDHPAGGWIVWPIGFDLLNATVARALGGPDASKPFILGVAAVMTPVLGCLCVLVTYALGRYLFGTAAGLAAALALALMPAHAATSRIGNFDHHVVEPLLSTLAYWLLVVGATLDDRRRGRAAAIAAGFALAGAYLFWTGFLMYLAPLVAWIGLTQLWVYFRGDSDPRFDGRVMLSFASAAVLIVPVTWTTPWGRDGAVQYYVLSKFHVLAMWTVFVLVCLLAVLRWTADRFRLPRVPALAGLLVLLAGGAGAAWTLSAELRETLALAAEFLGGGGTAILSASESLPLLYRGWGSAFALLTHNLVLAPVAAAVVLTTPIPRDEPSRARALVFIWLAVMGALGFMQRRFTPALAVPLSLLLGAAMAFGWSVAAPHASALVRGARRAVPVMILAAFVPALTAIGNVAVPGGTWQFAKLKPAMDWLRTETPAAGDMERPEALPAYSVFTDWGIGHWLIVVAERPAVVTPFGMAPWHDGASRSAFHIMTATDEAEALRRLRAVRARYYLATPIYPYRKMLQRIWDDEVRRGATAPASVVETHPDWIHTRLVMGDPQPGERRGISETLPALRHCRLVHESGDGLHFRSRSLGIDHTGPYARVYEIVPGARVTGACAPGEPISLTVPVETDLPRTLEWSVTDPCGPDGAFEIVVPYPSEEARLDLAGTARRVRIPESAVRNGEAVRVPTAPGA